MRIEIIAVDRLRAPWARDALHTYLERIGRYCEVERRTVKPSRREGRVGLEEEGGRILKRVDSTPRATVVALDPSGRGLPSSEWANMLRRWMNEGADGASFVVGGADGLSEGVLAAADEVLSLGPQTLAHELAQVVLAEQLYRAWTIVRGEPYHR